MTQSIETSSPLTKTWFDMDGYMHFANAMVIEKTIGRRTPLFVEIPLSETYDVLPEIKDVLKQANTAQNTRTYPIRQETVREFNIKAGGTLSGAINMDSNRERKESVSTRQKYKGQTVFTPEPEEP